MRIYNNLTKRVVGFKPHGTIAKIYVCGPSVYFESHAGHARTMVALDVMVRMIELEHKTVFARNITDFGYPCNNKYRLDAKVNNKRVDDIIAMSTADFNFCMDALGCRKPDYSPASSRHIAEMADYAAKLPKYESEGNYYFRTAESSYGQLSGLGYQEFAKEHCHNQVLWKGIREPWDIPLWMRADGDLEWNSRLGTGYPCAHLECAAMSHYYLGDVIDIHAGGEDLIFGHHENVLALCRAKKQDINCFVHTGLLTVNNRKMGKSDGNSVMLKQLIEKYGAGAVRLWALSNDYKSRLEFSEYDVAVSQKRYNDIIKPTHDGLLYSEKLERKLNYLGNKAIEALKNDLDTETSMTYLIESATAIRNAAKEGYGVERIPSQLRNSVRVVLGDLQR